MTVPQRLFILVITCGVLSTAPAYAANCSKNPDHPHCQPPPPPPPPEPPADDRDLCADATGVFPAFVYRTETVTGKRRRQRTTSDIYVANSSGDCEIKLHTADYAISELDYVQLDDGVGRVVWRESLSETSIVRMLEFKVESRVITSSLAAVPSPVYEDDHIHPRIDISDDGNTILYTDDKRDDDDQVLWHVNSIDVSNCASNCPVTEILEQVNGSAGLLGLVMNSDGTRIYFADSNSDTNLRRLAFLESQNGMWVGPTNVVTSDDVGYVDRSFRELDVQSHASGGGEIVAVHYEEGGVQTAVKVIGTGNCNVDPTRTQSCYAVGLSNEVGHIPFLALPMFSDIPFGATATPSLTVQTFENGNWVFYNADLDTFDFELVPGMPNERLAIGQ